MKIIDWQFYWPDWWRLWPHYQSYSHDWYNIPVKKFLFCFGPLQIMGYY